MGFRSVARPRRSEIPAALTLSGSVAAVAALLLPTATAGAAPLAPWAPPPVNSCGETGYDPLARQQPPAPPGPPPPQSNPTIHIPVPVPQIMPVPIPGPLPDNTRIDQQPLPEDPCANPCPDIRDDAKPKTDVPAPQDDPAATPDPAATGTGEPPQPTTPPATTPPATTPPPPSTDNPLGLPQIQIDPQTEPIPIPVPGGEPPEPQPAPTPDVQPAAPAPVAAAPAKPQVQSVDLVDQVTGHGSANRTDMRWSVDGTDLGLIWETKPGQVAVVFGDTFGKGWEAPGAGTGDQDWRSNTIAYSSNRDLSKGLTLDSFVEDSRCHAAQILDSRKIANFEITTIPTSGFAIGDRQYLTYMSVNRWSRIPGMWWTNLGGIAWSDDNGRTWTKSQWAQWDNLFGVNRFQVSTMVPHDDYVYVFGTPNGRMGFIGLGRVPKDQVLNKSAYQYWVNGNWEPTAGPGQLLATSIADGMAGEVSVRYDQDSGLWQMTYLDVSKHQIVLRTAAEPQGTWSAPVALVDTDDYPAAYGGFMHPWSTGKDLYFTMSAWNSYNVYLMHASLDPAH